MSKNDTTSKIKMKAPDKPGKPSRTTTISQDKRSDYEKKGYKYIGLADGGLEGTDKVKGTKKTSKPKKVGSALSTEKSVKSENKMNLSIFEIYKKIKEDKKILNDIEEDCGQNREDEGESMEEQNATGSIAGMNLPLGFDEEED